MKTEMMMPPKKFRMCLDKGDSKIDDIIRLNGHRKEVYLSVYNFNDEVHKKNVIIDKIFIDFDPEKDENGEIIDEVKPYTDCKKLAQYLRNNGISFYIRFSGRGFHIYINTKEQNYEHNIGVKIKQYVRDLANELNITPDYQVVGDLRRMSRAINTINSRTNLYCIPLSYNELMELPYHYIKKLAITKGRDCDVINNGNEVDLSEIFVRKTENFIKDEVQSINSYSNTFISLPPCLSKLLEDPNIGYRERFFIILYAREMGYTIKEVENFIEENISEEKAYHCIHEENQVESIFDREDILFPTCSTLRNDGYCVGNCGGIDLYI